VPLKFEPVTVPEAATLVGEIAPSVNVIAGVVVEFATLPLIPFAVTTETLVTEPAPAEPLLAEVILPCASTVILANVYDPAETAVFAKAIVPVVVIIPPDNPVPAVIEVTVPVLDVYPDGLALLYGVNPNALVTSPEVSDNVPPNVKLPVVVTEPLSVNPLTVPVPPTDVTVPVFDVLLLNIVQSEELNTPRLEEDAVGIFNVITGVVVLSTTVEFTSVPVVPIVNAATDVTVPGPTSGPQDTTDPFVVRNLPILPA
jgi:hypothetical protein